MAKLSPIGNDAQFINGIPANGAKLFTYASGSSTKQTTYTGEDGLTPQSNPIILDSRGEPSQPIWLTEGLEYKFVFASSTDTDPPSSPIWDIDNITGVNDASLTIDQWVISGITPTYINATTFTMPGDQTTEFQVNRRVKLSVTAGTVYGYIASSAYAALTTVTVQLDSGVLDAGLSSVSLGLITPTNTSLFLIGNSNLDNQYIDDLTAVTFDPALDYVAISDASDSGNKKKAKLSFGRVLAQIQTFTTGTMATGTTVIPDDNTIPQITEGDQYMSLAITPQSATSTLEIDITFNMSTASSSSYGIGALFQDSTANALAAVRFINPTTADNSEITFKHIMTSGTTSATTFKLRLGSSGAGTTTFNGTDSVAFMGGILASRITIKEYLP